MCACCVGSNLVWSIFELKEASRQKQNRMSCLITQNNELPLCTTTHCRSNHGIVRKRRRILTELMQCMILSDYSNMRVWGSFFGGKLFLVSPRRTNTRVLEKWHCSPASPAPCELDRACSSAPRMRLEFQ